ncbi:MAG: L,D-transpeptidase family protein [Sulfurovum sp.]
MKIKILLALIAVMLLSGCVGIKDSEGWKSSQKSEFLDILEDDKYASICDETKLYEQAKEDTDSKLMTKLLIAYTRNLANGCINLRKFKASQRSKRARKIDTKYVTYLQTVNDANLVLQLKAGKTIEEILAPFVPKYRQFNALIKVYGKLDKKSATAKKVRINIERVKLLKHNIGSTFALVNIPEFKVRIIEGDKTALKMAVIVGKRNMQTPIFSAKLKYMTLNPQWSVPDSIARNEIIPKLIRNKNYAKGRNMVIIKDTYDLRGKKVKVSSVDWKKYSGGKGYVPYKFVQVPSRRNGLGRVKFIFPNSNAVYMHDTLNKRLFNRKVRTFSHGCIRLHKPVKMMNHITKTYTATSNKTVKSWYDKMKTKHVSLNKNLPVHTAYLTAYVNDSGKLLIFSDVYGYDKSQRLVF